MKTAVFYILFILLFLFNKSLLAQFSTSDQKIVSGFYTFIINTEWKNEKNFKLFTIGILDKDSSFYKQCVEKYEGIKLKDSPVKIAFYNSIDIIGDCQVLYVNKKFNKNIEAVVQKITGKNTLLITNTCKNEKVIMINYNNVLKSLTRL